MSLSSVICSPRYWSKGARSSACDQFVRVLVKKQLHLRFHLLFKPTRWFECLLATGGESSNLSEPNT